jgi:FkbM family methyltransferase
MVVKPISPVSVKRPKKFLVKPQVTYNQEGHSMQTILHDRHLLARGHSFWRRFEGLSTLSNPFDALRLIFRIKKNPSDVHAITYNNAPLYFRGCDEQVLYEVLLDQEYAFVAPLVSQKENPIILDVGAHIGAFATWILSVNPSARVLSLEAAPHTCEILRTNAKTLKNMGSDWQVLHGAASNTDGNLLKLSTQGPSMGNRIRTDGDTDVSSISLKSLLEQLCSPDEKIDLLKVDIEGSEELFLCSHPSLLGRIDALVVEVHPHLCNQENILKTIRSTFSHVEEIGDRKSTKPLLYCHR